MELGAGRTLGDLLDDCSAKRPGLGLGVSVATTEEIEVVGAAVELGMIISVVLSSTIAVTVS